MATTYEQINEKKLERHDLAEQAKAAVRQARADGGEWKGENEAEHTKRMADIHRLSEEIKVLDEQRAGETDEAFLDSLLGDKPAQRKTAPDPLGGKTKVDGSREFVYKRKTHPYSDGNRRYFRDHQIKEIRYELDASNHRQRDSYEAAGSEYRKHYLRYLTHGERRALEMTSDPAGGYLVPPEFMSGLIQSVDDRVFMRQFGTVLPMISGESLGMASLDADPADFDWTSELLTGSEDSTMSFGKRQLAPHPLAKRIKVSEKLLRATAGSAESIVRERLAYKQAITQEKAFLTGDGVEQPLGVFTASTSGVTTDRDFNTGSSTSFTLDGLTAAKYSLKAPYRANSAWLFHRDGISKIAQLSGDTDKEIWRPSMSADEPDTLLGRPIFESEYVPNAFTAETYAGMLADFSYYWIVDALNMRIQRLDELYAETNQVGFIARSETDAMPVLAEAFVRLKTDPS